MTTAPSSSPADAGGRPHAMTCTEIWGGTRRSDHLIQTPGMDIHVFSEPYRGHEAGGDIHFVCTCGSGHITRLLLADVSGHGERIADLADTLRELLKRHIHTIDNSDLARALNDEFAALAEGGRFATAIIVSYFAPTDQLIVVNAGHPRPLWYRAKPRAWGLLTDEAAAPQSAAPQNLPLGIIGDTSYRQFVVNLEPEDRLVLYSDALVEAASPEGAPLGEQGLLDAAASDNAGEIRALTDRLLRAADEHRGGQPADDDATILAVHHTAKKTPRPSLGDKLTTLAQMIGLTGVRTVEG